MKPQVSVRGKVTTELRRVITLAAQAALADQSVSSGLLAVALIDPERMQALNREFAGVDQTTDVLSFPDGTPDPQSGQAYLGDIAICLPVAQAQASAAGHPLEAELSLLTVHGVLHLLGHDHAGEDEQQRMWRAQDRIMHRLGIVDWNPA